MIEKRYYFNSRLGDTKIAHLSLKGIGRFIFHTVRSYDKFKPYYSRISFGAKYKMR